MTPPTTPPTAAERPPRATILHGDCVELMRELPAESVDVVLTDPPYSSGTRREASKGVRKSMTRGTGDAEWFGSDSLTVNGFLWLMRSAAVQWARVLRPGGHALAFIDWRMSPQLAAAIESADLRHAGLLVWDKTHFGMGSCFRNQHELVLHFTKGVGAPPSRRDVGNVISCPPVPRGKMLHPTEKPVALLRRLLGVVAPPGSVVLDSFAGSGATGEAAALEGHDAILVERELPYVEKMRARLGAPAVGAAA